MRKEGMKIKSKIRRRLCCLFVITPLIPLCSCTVMNARYHKWDQAVSRTPEGVLEYMQAKDYGQGENALLLVHGFGDGPHVWKSLAPCLAEKGYYVRAMRLPAWGEPIESKRMVMIEDWENAVRGELEKLHQDHKKVVILAHSMGGCLTTVMAQKKQLQADALVLYAPMFEISSARSPFLKTSTWFKIGSAILPDNMIIESIYGDHARVNPPRPRTERDPFNPKHIFVLLYEEMDRFEAQPPAVDIPVRLTLPGEDRVVRSERSLLWFNDLQAPVKNLEIIEPAGHVLPLDMDVLAESNRLVIWLSEQGIAP